MKVSKCVFLLCSLSVFGALLQDDPEITSHQAAATFSSKVNLVSVPVVVRDSKGHAVGGLRQEDFRLFDSGKQQVITKFSVQTNAVQGNAAPASGAAGAKQANPSGAAISAPAAAAGKPPLPDRYVAYVFDDMHLRWQDLVQMRAAAERHFAEALAPASRAAIYTTSGRVSLDFTDDRQKLHETLLRIGLAPDAFSGFSSQDGSDCPPDIPYYTADMMLNQMDLAAGAAATAEVIACYGPTPDAGYIARGIAETVLASNRMTTQTSLGSLANVVRRMAAMPGSRTIILVSAGFMVPSELRPEEMDLMDRAIHANVAISSLNPRGVITYFMGNAASQRQVANPDSPRVRYKLAGAAADEDVMADLADGTGGKFFHNDNGFEEGLNELAAPPEFTYILGFSPQNLKLDGSYHNLKITLVNSKGLELQARRGYWTPAQAADAAEQSREEIQEAVFSMEEVHDIPVDVTTDFFKSSDAAAELTVEAHLDLNGLKFRTAGDRNIDTLTVVTGLFDQDGRYVKGIQRVIDLRLRQQTLEKVLGSGMAVTETFEVPPGRYVVRVVARDSEGQTMAARNGTVDIR